MTKRILNLGGMHRSGTSLTAKWLYHCGLFVGENLLEGHADNPGGHFEDIDFLNFHEEALKANDLSHLIRPNVDIQISDGIRENARFLLKTKMQRDQWGWKEPRTALFLDLWKDLIPEMRVLIVYRPYLEVVDSLLRRQQKRMENFPHKRSRLVMFRETRKLTWWNLPLINLYLETWQRYNQDLLAFAKKYPDDVAVVPLEKTITHSMDVLDLLIDKWGFELERKPISEVYEPKSLTKEETYPLPSRLHNFARYDETYRQLQALDFLR